MMVHELTKAQMEAFKWLQERNGDGVFERNHQVLLASGERAPHTRATWNALAKAGLVEFYMNNKRLRLTQGGPMTHLNEKALEAAAIALGMQSGMFDSKKQFDYNRDLPAAQKFVDQADTAIRAYLSALTSLQQEGK